MTRSRGEGHPAGHRDGRRAQWLAAGAGVALATFVLVVVTTGPAAACPAGSLVHDLIRDPDPTPGPRGSSPEQQALALLDGAAQAARETPYQGVQVISSWGGGGARTALVEVEHVPGRGTLLTVVGTPADPGAQMYEEDWGSAATTGLRGMSATLLHLLGRNYAVARTGQGSVAGRSASVVEARRDDGSLAARFWVDRDSGLMLRRQVFDRRGRVVRVSAFIDLRLARATFQPHLPPATPGPWEDRLTRRDLVSLRGQGWTAPERLPGGLVLIEARKKADADGGPVLHLSYSDGLSMVSLFVQRGKLDTDKFEAWGRAEFAGNAVYVHETVQQRVVWAGPRHVYTLMADAPPETVRATVAALPHEDHRGFWRRVARGLSRIGSWLNPF